MRRNAESDNEGQSPSFSDGVSLKTEVLAGVELEIEAFEKYEPVRGRNDMPQLYKKIVECRPKMDSLHYVVSCMASVAGGAPKGSYAEYYPESPDDPVREKEERHIVEFLGMCGFLVLAKPITTDPYNNTRYLTQRWKAYVAGTKRTYPEIQLSQGMIACLKSVQDWFHVHTHITRLWVMAVLDVKLRLEKEMLNQIILVWQYHGMKALKLMREFTAKPMAVFSLTRVLTEAVAFNRKYDALLDKWKTLFPYLGVLKIEDLAQVTHRDYADLYYCAITYELEKGNMGGKGGHFKHTAFDTTTARSTLRSLLREVAKSTDQVLNVDDMVANLKMLGQSFAPDAIMAPRARKRRRQESESEEED